MNALIKCKCGCGSEINKLDKRGRKRTYVPGHQMKDYAFILKPDADVNYGTAHARARKIKPSSNGCQIKHLGGCHHLIQIHHIDGNAWNNSESNLISLCKIHHYLVESRNIDLDNPIMPDVRIFPNGRRVWPTNKQYLQRIRPHRYNMALKSPEDTPLTHPAHPNAGRIGTKAPISE